MDPGLFLRTREDKRQKEEGCRWMLDVLEDESVEGRRNMVGSTSVLEDERMMDALEENGSEECSRKK